MEDKLALLHQTTANYTSQEKENFSIDYLEKLIIKTTEFEIEASNRILEKIDLILNSLPIKMVSKRLEYNNKCLNDITNLKSFVKENFNLIPNGYYRKKYLAFGLAIGPSFGLLIGAFMGKGKIAIGLPLGIPIGMAIGLTMGKHHDEKAKKENRVI